MNKYIKNMALSVLLTTTIILSSIQTTIAQSPVPVPQHRPRSPIADNAEKAVHETKQEAVGTAFENCLTKLTELGVIYSRQAAFEEENGCKITDPVKIISVPNGANNIGLKAQPMLSCQFATRLANWLSDVSAPITECLSKSALVSVLSGPGYVCRHRYNDNTKKISQHALGNAIDLTGFAFADGSKIAISSVLSGSTEEKKMLAALRQTSCGYFTTVLGPGTNEAHKSHFHLDHGKHGRTWSYRICE